MGFEIYSIHQNKRNNFCTSNVDPINLIVDLKK